MRLGQLDASSNTTSESIRRAYDLIESGFGPGTNGPLTVVVALPSSNSSQQNQTLLTNTQKSISSTPNVAGVGSPLTNKAGTLAVMTVVPTTAPQDAQTTALVDQLLAR